MEPSERPVSVRPKFPFASTPVSKTGLLICLLLCIAALLCFHFGIQGVSAANQAESTDSSLDFYRSHYTRCSKSYYETMATAYSYAPGYFRNNYLYIAQEYQDMMDSDQAQIDRILEEYEQKRNDAKRLMIFGGVLLCAAIVFALFDIYRRTKRGALPD